VLNFNQRSVSEIFDFIELIARLINRQAKGRELIAAYQSELEKIANAADAFPWRPRVFFEEWNEPLISGIEWVEELIELAGGEPIFPELRRAWKAKDRIVQPDQVIERNPDVIVASWCGMKVDTEAICSRPGWGAIAAIRNRHVYEMPSSNILQPGPASLTDGIRELHRILEAVASSVPWPS
jgi:iron complex transport system substrate-binding protein